MSEYILYSEDVLSSELCDKILEDVSQKPECINSGVVLEEELSKEIYPEMHSIITAAVREFIATHKIDSFPDDWGLEPFHVRGFQSGEELEQYQIDVGSHDMARRFLGLFWTIKEGGTTIEFYQQDIKLTPAAGSMFVYPSLWTHPQLKTLPTGDDVEYVLGTYLHYI